VRPCLPGSSRGRPACWGQHWAAECVGQVHSCAPKPIRPHARRHLVVAAARSGARVPRPAARPPGPRQCAPGARQSTGHGSQPRAPGSPRLSGRSRICGGRPAARRRSPAPARARPPQPARRAPAAPRRAKPRGHAQGRLCLLAPPPVWAAARLTGVAALLSPHRARRRTWEPRGAQASQQSLERLSGEARSLSGERRRARAPLRSSSRAPPARPAAGRPQRREPAGRRSARLAARRCRSGCGCGGARAARPPRRVLGCAGCRAARPAAAARASAAP